jgi:hypothetical protein
MSIISTVSDDCAYVQTDITMTSVNAGQIQLIDYSGIFTQTNTAHTPSGISVTDTAYVTLPGNGVFTVQFYDTVTSLVTASSAIVVACDIDCCIAKQVNELIDCACECHRCSKALALAQEVYLLLYSAKVAAGKVDISTAAGGYVLDAYKKYIKAKELCDLSCGCNC